MVLILSLLMFLVAFTLLLTSTASIVITLGIVLSKKRILTTSTLGRRGMTIRMPLGRALLRRWSGPKEEASFTVSAVFRRSGRGPEFDCWVQKETIQKFYGNVLQVISPNTEHGHKTKRLDLSYAESSQNSDAGGKRRLFYLKKVRISFLRPVSGLFFFNGSERLRSV